MNETQPRSAHFSWNVPNILTLTRILISAALFVVMPFHCYLTALILFVIGSLTDFFDGWWARKYGQVTKFGRITDPFADKLLVCGTLIYLAVVPEIAVPLPCCGNVNIGLAPWMVVVIVSRELLVTQLRSMVEASGGDFSAKWLGKVKMTFQCIALIGCFLHLYLMGWSERFAGNLLFDGIVIFVKWGMVISLWVMVYLTIKSCVGYIQAAVRASKSSEA